MSTRGWFRVLPLNDFISINKFIETTKKKAGRKRAR